jgi:hypothetical protein
MNNKKKFWILSICTVIYGCNKNASNNQNAADTDSTVVDTAVISNTNSEEPDTVGLAELSKEFWETRGHGKHIIEIKSLNSLPIGRYGDRTKLTIGFKKEENGIELEFVEIMDGTIHIPHYQDPSYDSYITFKGRPRKIKIDEETTYDFCERAQRSGTCFIHIYNEEGEGTFIFNTRNVDWSKLE